ncbi:DUF2917 domain-containing protein [Paracidovorax citrulli]|uniref:DUF2917 domain-containing protein n=1 Tax=Paracidovorax citrulli TaxID=80869 RepID=UPI0002FAB15C|nr:DUF2917 domain-containing protein [Paracidovorax citrulli]QCX09996.1 hypothetical protein APS58_1086 [Paracidovorax citrulli]UEG47011.1 DUF2917 domain-containing protein [Paracidovorax citrulli]UMT89704.1 DUF2917 domain-containing protein [Paracidovorax citrulli]UMT93784.1 DUF2917 domain-containing protein [Paracidovorax citrulli]WIY35522.1 DUF2917 domain-containing protein [Paracidovorax citrulli]
MSASHVLNFQQSAARDRATGMDVYRLDSGKAHSLRPRVPMALRIASGRAWVTIDDGLPGGSDPAAGDIVLHAGQTLWIAAGQHAVIEPLGKDAVQYYRFDISRVVKGESAGQGVVSACCA